jgi:hypothetical protein
MLIGTKYKIETDRENFVLKQVTESKKDDEEDAIDDVLKEKGWKTIGYFSDFRELLRYMTDHEIKGVGLNDLKVVAKKQEELCGLIFRLQRLTPSELTTKIMERPHSEV